MPERKISDELAELTEAVRELRDREVAAEIRELRGELEKLRAEREHHHCNGCHSGHVTWVYPYTTWPSQAWISQPYTVTCGDGYSSVTTTNTTAGYNPTVTTLSLTN